MDFLSTRPIWILNLISTWFMIGLIWFVQIVHYPLHGLVPEEGFSTYQKNHMTWTTWVVAVPMFCEALTAGFLAYYPPQFGARYLWWFGFLLVLVNLISTYTLYRPLHQELREGFDHQRHRFLVKTNWIRTITWSIRGVLWIYLLNKI